MPKERRKRTIRHDSPVRLAKRDFAVQDNAAEHVEIGDAVEASGTEILQSLSAPEARSARNKREKKQTKREAFLKQLESSNSPYSKSHNRRMKRKAKEQIANGLNEMQVAIEEIDKSAPEPTETIKGGDVGQKLPIKTGMIGEGKKTPLSRAQRKRALQLEQVRHPLILANTQFASNPFQTIRTHALNTLVKHQIPQDK